MKLNDMKNNEFKCAMCENVYEKSRSEEEAQEECIDNFGEQMANHAEMDIVCDTCYQEIKPSEHPKELKEAKMEFQKAWDEIFKIGSEE